MYAWRAQALGRSSPRIEPAVRMVNTPPAAIAVPIVLGRPSASTRLLSGTLLSSYIGSKEKFLIVENPAQKVNTDQLLLNEPVSSLPYSRLRFLEKASWERSGRKYRNLRIGISWFFHCRLR